MHHLKKQVSLLILKEVYYLIFPGAFLPQRSYFTNKKEHEVINFSSCDLLDAGDYIGSTIALPIGSLQWF